MSDLKQINAATHKRVFYRIIRGSDTEVQLKCENKANLINECNGKVYGTTPISTIDESIKVMMSFEIPTLNVNKFLNEEQALGKDKIETATTK